MALSGSNANDDDGNQNETSVDFLLALFLLGFVSFILFFVGADEHLYQRYTNTEHTHTHTDRARARTDGLIRAQNEIKLLCVHGKNWVLAF